MKYELLDYEQRRMYDGINHKVRQIRALKDIPQFGVKKGDIGGWISGNSTLSQAGDCWIGAHSYVLSSDVSGDVFIRESEILNSQIHGVEGGTNRILNTKVIQSNITKSSFDFYESLIVKVKVEDSVFSSNESIVRKVELHHSTFHIVESDLESKGEPLVIMIMDKSKVNIKDSKIIVDTEKADDARIHFGLTVDNVQCLTPIKKLTMFEALVLKNLHLNEIKLFTGRFREEPGQCKSSIIGYEKTPVTLANSFLELKNSDLIGNFQVRGNVILKHVKIKDRVTIESHDFFSYLCLTHVKMQDFAKIIKFSSGSDEVLGKTLTMEDEIILE